MAENFKNKKFVFAGNRFFILEEMIKSELNLVKIFAVSGSYLEKELRTRKINYDVIDKHSFVEQIKNLEFNVFIANGLPQILPISQLNQNSEKVFINIHPSYLPELRGKDPIPGAILFQKDSGATCHYMNDGIDEGDIIEQVKIDYTNDLDCALLYQLSFLAEKIVFNKSLHKNFEVLMKQTSSDKYVKYKIREEDKLIDFKKSSQEILQKIKTFNTASQGAYFYIKDKKFIVKNGKVVSNEFIKTLVSEYKENEIVFIFENKIVLKKECSFLYLEEVSGELLEIKTGILL